MVIEKLKCEVCGKDAVGVAASTLSPISVSYCDECLKECRESYKMLVSTVSCAGIKNLKDINEIYRNKILKNLDYYKKSEEDFMLDVEKCNEKISKHFSDHKFNDNLE